jgi:CspA family cold shock protein
VIRATVDKWSDAEGWGVLSAPELTGNGIWAHFSAVEMEGFKSLVPGERVEVAFEDLGSPLQDGYRYRATRVRPVS